MMTELSLNVLDIANNSIRAEASLVEITVRITNGQLDTLDNNSDTITIIIKDNGCGMTKEQLARVEDPFFTTRTTRGVGLGVPFFKQAALGTGGSFSIESEAGKGTIITATFCSSHIDCLPLGDINNTIYTLIILNTTIDFLYTYQNNCNSFSLDTREIREILDDIPINSPEVSAYIKAYLEDNKKEADII